MVTPILFKKVVLCEKKKLLCLFNYFIDFLKEVILKKSFIYFQKGFLISL